LVPGKKDLSGNITVKRIVDRYLEHSRIFVFYNGGEKEVFCGSADWMNRNIYHRIEVCFPVYSEQIKKELISIIGAQCDDTEQAVVIDDRLRNTPIVAMDGRKVRSQEAIYTMIASAFGREGLQTLNWNGKSI
jgi:polyphosphate kinase